MPKRRLKTEFTDIEWAFIREYCVDCNSTRAYRRVRPAVSLGTASSAGSALMAKSKIREEIAKRQKTLADKIGITAEGVLRELHALAFNRIDDYITVNKNGDINIDLTGMTTMQAAALQSVETEKYWDKGANNGYGAEVTRVKFKAYDKKSALELLGRHLNVQGFGTSKLELTGKNGGPVQVADVGKMTRDQLRAIVSAGPTQEEDNAEPV